MNDKYLPVCSSLRPPSSLSLLSLPPFSPVDYLPTHSPFLSPPLSPSQRSPFVSRDEFSLFSLRGGGGRRQGPKKSSPFPEKKVGKRRRRNEKKKKEKTTPVVSVPSANFVGSKQGKEISLFFFSFSLMLVLFAPCLLRPSAHTLPKSAGQTQRGGFESTFCLCGADVGGQRRSVRSDCQLPTSDACDDASDM